MVCTAAPGAGVGGGLHGPLLHTSQLGLQAGHLLSLARGRQL